MSWWTLLLCALALGYAAAVVRCYRKGWRIQYVSLRQDLVRYSVSSRHRSIFDLLSAAFYVWKVDLLRGRSRKSKCDSVDLSHFESTGDRLGESPGDPFVNLRPNDGPERAE